MRSLLCSRFLCISASGANVSAVSFRAPCATIPAKKQIRKICPETGECISDPFPTNQQTSGGSFCAGTFHAQQKAAGSRVKSTYRAENPTDFRQIACRPDISFHPSMFYSASAILETNKFFSAFRLVSELCTFFSNSAYNSSNFSAVCSGGFFSMRYR